MKPGYDGPTPTWLREAGVNPIPPRIVAAVTREMGAGRRESQPDWLTGIPGKFRSFFQFPADPVFISASEEGALEGAVVNFFSPGDRVLFGITGEQGRLLADIGQAFGLDVLRLGCAGGEPVRAGDIDLFLSSEAGKGVRGVCMTHHDSSTGVCSSLEPIGRICRKHKLLFVVNAVHSLGILPLEVDRCAIDLVVAATPGGFMGPPGLGIFWIGSRAREAGRRAACPRFARDLIRAEQRMDPALTPLLAGVNEALDLIQEEGWDRRYDRLHRNRRMFRRGVEAMGLTLWVRDQAAASPVVTVVNLPEGVSAERVGSFLTAQGVAAEPGEARSADRLLRVGHGERVSTGQVIASVIGLGWACQAQDVEMNLEAALAAAREVSRNE